jgi:hypothetical protein
LGATVVSEEAERRMPSYFSSCGCVGAAAGSRMVESSVTAVGSELPVSMAVMFVTEPISVRPLNSATVPVTLSSSPTETGFAGEV